MARAPFVSVQAEDVAHQEVAALEVAAVLVDDAADVQALLEQVLVLRVEALPELLQLLQRRFAAQLPDDVVLGAW